MKRIGWFFLLLALAGCEKDINFKLDEASTTVVIDASIENGMAPVVVVSNSLDFFSELNPAVLSRTFIHDAVVTVSDGTRVHQLKEYQYDPSPGITLYYYSIDSTNLATAFVGELNHSYSLEVKTGGKLFTANTTIPALEKGIDSIWWRPAPFQEEDTTKVIVMAKFTDPPGLGNYVRYYTKKNDDPFWPGENSVFDDQVIDGTTYEIQVQPGIDRNNRPLLKDNFFKRGDSVILKLANIDRPTFIFWTTLEFSYQSIGNPFSQPIKVLGNISNGALGAFSGYAGSQKAIKIPE